MSWSDPCSECGEHRADCNCGDWCGYKRRRKEEEEKYPKNIVLRKINTLEDAEYPQAEKYPEGTERTGFMWEYTVPKIGTQFRVMQSKLWASFYTSEITEILSETPEKIVFKTLNSTYELQIR